MSRIILVGLLMLAPGVPIGTAAAQQATSAPARVSKPPAESGSEAGSPGAGSRPQADADQEESRTLGDWYALGGWVMHLLVACSVLALALALERLWVTRRRRVISRSFLAKIREPWQRRDLRKVLEYCHESDTAIARVLRVGLMHLNLGLAQSEDAIEGQCLHETSILRRNLPLLGALGNIATMLGLFGTVLGMIESFDLIAKTGTGDARVVAGGIFTALVTTAAGLMVGIPTVLTHAFLRRRVDVLEIELSEVSVRLLEDLVEEGTAVPSPEAPPAKADLAPQGA